MVGGVIGRDDEMSSHLGNLIPIESAHRADFFVESTLVRSCTICHSSHNRPMTEKEIVLETIRTLPDDCSLEGFLCAASASSVSLWLFLPSKYFDPTYESRLSQTS